MNETESEILAKKGYLRASEVARRTGKTLPAVYYWIEQKQVEAVRVGSHWYVSKASLISLYREQDPKAVELLGLEKA